MLLNGSETVNTLTLNKTLYTSPYMVVNEQEYTKHYYIEGERICSKIGGGFGSVQAPPPILDSTGGNTSNIATQLWTLVNRGLRCTGTTVNNVSISPSFSAINNNESQENYQYFYHSDHLGSSSYITNKAGNAIEHLQYLPYGENFVSQQSTDYNTPYKFSGKEKDDETSYSYFGSRYYDSELSIWLSVDPLADKFPSQSPFTYCSNNPIGRIDPKGASDDNVIVNGEGEVTKIEKNNLPNRLFVEDSKVNGGNRTEITFNDPKNDEKLLDNVSVGQKVVNRFSQGNINWFTEKTIGSAEGGIYIGYEPGIAFSSASGGGMDFSAHYLWDAYGTDGFPIEKTSEAESTPMFTVFGTKPIAYNIMDAGNYLWGYSMQKMGYSEFGSKFAANTYSVFTNGGKLDAGGDLRAITAGSKAAFQNKTYFETIQPKLITNKVANGRNW